MASMFFKRYLPRSLFGRTILILLFPIVLVEIAVGIAFIQRHFEQVTTQLSKGLELELIYIIDEIQLEQQKKITSEIISDRTQSLGQRLGLSANFLTQEKLTLQNKIGFLDLSGRPFVSNIRKTFGTKVAFDLSKKRDVNIQILIPSGRLDLTIPRKRISASNPHQLLVLMLFLTVLLVIVALLTMRNQIRPITRLAKAAEAFGKGQSMPYRPGGSDEVRRAGIAFLAMRARIERQIQQRTQMLSGVSHDLRTPLTRLKLALALVEEKIETSDMLEDVNSMQQMLDEFLDFSKVNKVEDASKVKLPEYFKLFVKRNKEQGIKITLKIDQTVLHIPEIYLKRNAFTRAIQNLINNANIYGKLIILNITKEHSNLIILVEDDGPGIKEKDFEMAMRPFTRLDKSRNQNNHTGVGLGLSITLDVVRSHGGRLSLHRSRNLGGLLARVEIPI